MSYIEAILLGILQGITEFLPVSSSGHLAVVEHFMKLPVSPAVLQAFDVMVHCATLLAVCIVFRKTILEAFTSHRNRIIIYITGCIPAGLAGILLKLYGKNLLDSFKGSLACVSAAFITTGLILLLTRLLKVSKRNSEEASVTDALRVGLYQAAALLPGISRSGVTISGGIIGGMSREAAARFSFVMAVPLILGATAIEAKDLFSGNPIPYGVLLAGFTAALLAGLGALLGLLAVIKRGRLWLFSIYLLPLGASLFIYSYAFETRKEKTAEPRNHPAVIRLLNNLAKSDKEQKIEALINLDLPSKELIPDEVIKCLASDDEIIRYSAAVGIGHMGDERALFPLLDVLKAHPWESMSQYDDVVFALKKIGQPAIQGLIQMLLDLEQIFLAQYALGKMEKEAVEPLLALLQNSNYTVIATAAGALGEIGDNAAVPYLIKLLDNKYQTVRSNAGKALGKIGDLSAVKPLEKMLADSDHSARVTAVSALANLKPPAVDSLIIALESDNEDVRTTALRELWTLKPKKAVGPLIKMLGSPKKMPNTAYCLIVITGNDFGENYEKWKDWYDINMNSFK